MFVLRIPSIGTVSSCSPLIPRFAPVARFSFPLVSFPHMCVPVRLACRLVMSSCRASRLVRSVASCCPSCRLACSFRSSFRLSVRFARRLDLAPFRSAVRSFLLRLPERDCLAFPCRLVSHWHPVCLSSCSSFCRSVPLAVSSCSSRFCPVISFSLIRGRFGSVFMSVPVFAPFRSAVRSFLFVHRSRFFCLRRGEELCVMKRRRLVLVLLISSVSSRSYSLFARSLRGLWG